MTQQLRVTREVDFTGAAQIGVGGGINNLLGGKTFFVNSSTGSNSYEGTSPAYPLADVATALGKCTTLKHDYIFVQNFSTLTDPPLTIAKWDIHLIGLGHGGFDQGVALNPSNDIAVELGEGACIDLELAGFVLGGGISQCINGSSIYRIHLHHLGFGTNYAATDGIKAMSFAHSVVDYCNFDVSLTGDGIDITDCNRNIFANNTFHNVTGKGIYLNLGAQCNKILDNSFGNVIGKADGWAIDLAAGSKNNLIAGNRASECGDASQDTGEPYYDRSNAALASQLNAWTDNKMGNAFGDGIGTGT